MRLIGILGVLCFAVAPALAAPVTYEVTAQSGSLTLSLQGQGSTTGGLGGTFTFEADPAHLGDGTLVSLTGAGLSNTTAMKLGIAGIATANVAVGSAKILDFIQPAPAAIASGTAVCNTDAYLDAVVVVSGAFNTTFATATSAGTLLPVSLTVSTSGAVSSIANVSIDFIFGYEVGIPDIGLTITLDLIMNVEGTAHVVPDPALGGLTALGLGGAGAWLRRRS